MKGRQKGRKKARRPAGVQRYTRREKRAQRAKEAAKRGESHSPKGRGVRPPDDHPQRAGREAAKSSRPR